MMSAGIDTAGGALAAGAPTRLFSTRTVGRAVGNQIDRQFDVARDGAGQQDAAPVTEMRLARGLITPRR